MSKGTWRVNEDGDFVLVGRVTNAAGSLITQASVSTINVKVGVQDEDDEAVIEGTATFDDDAVKTSVIYDTAQTNEVLWPAAEHPDGYNFRCTIPGSAVPTGDEYYNAEVTITLASATNDFGDAYSPIIKLLYTGIYAVPGITA